MPKVEDSIEVQVPVQQAYNQWTQFEEFPTFMDGVKEVRQLDDTHLHWKAEIAGKTKEWDAVKASQKLKVTWSQVADPFPDQAQLYDYIRKAPVTKADEQKKGDLEAAFAKAAKIVEAAACPLGKLYVVSVITGFSTAGLARSNACLTRTLRSIPPYTTAATARAMPKCRRHRKYPTSRNT